MFYVVPLVTNGVFDNRSCIVLPTAILGLVPETALPYASFAFCNSDARPPLGTGQRLYKANLDRLPAIGKIVVARRQRPDGMHVVWQHHPGIDMERPVPFCCTHRLAQFANMPHQQIQTPLQQIHRKKIRPTRNPISSIIRHLISLGSL